MLMILYLSGEVLEEIFNIYFHKPKMVFQIFVSKEDRSVLWKNNSLYTVIAYKQYNFHQQTFKILGGYDFDIFTQKRLILQIKH